jgi:hypothetical protein
VDSTVYAFYHGRKKLRHKPSTRTPSRRFENCGQAGPDLASNSAFEEKEGPMKVSHALGLLLASLGFCTFSWMAGCSSSDESDAGTDGGKDSGNADTGSGTDGATDTGTTGGATVPTCSEFCDLSIASCGASGANAQFANKGQCTRACDALPPGTGNETSGNSVSCRTYHAGVAGQPGNAAVHCPHSGFSGGGTCGDRCQAFCQIVTDLCVPPLAKPFASLADCVAACGTDAGFPGFDVTQGEYDVAQSTKNNLNCRQYWLWKALEDVDGGDGGSAATNCPRLGLKGVTTNGLTPSCVD